MKEKILIVNAGSSSLKFSVYEIPEKKELINGIVEKIGLEDSFCSINLNGQKIVHKFFAKDHIDATKLMLRELLDSKVITDLSEIKNVGHRILHGGEYYSSSVVIDEEVIKNIEKLTKLGPLHHPVELSVILTLQNVIPDITNVAVFDTAFHQTMPKKNYLYAVPYEWYENNGVRKYGFHGTSHKYITCVMQDKLNKKDINIISCHLGNGASVACIKNGECYDTSMGLTPLDGVIMGTRSGAIDPSIISYMMSETNKSVEEIINDLNKKSGLYGICGKGDFRDLLALIDKNDEKAKIAYAKFRDSVVRYIAEYYVELDANVDAIVFTAGVGENVISMRKSIIDKLARPLHLELDEKENDSIAKFKDKHEGKITTGNSSIPVYVIPTNEELMILNDTYDLTREKNKKLDLVK